MLDAVQNHSARVIIIDEIRDTNEVAAAKTMSNQGMASPPQSLVALHIIAGPYCYLYAPRYDMHTHTLDRTRPHATTSRSKHTLYNTPYTLLVGEEEAGIHLQDGHGVVLPCPTQTAQCVLALRPKTLCLERRMENKK